MIGVSSETMKRINHHLTVEQVKALRSLSRKTGLPVAELIRRAVDLYLQTQTKKEAS